MTKKEKDEILKELRKELKDELREVIREELKEVKATPKTKAKGEDFDFAEYKKTVVEDDIKKVEDFMLENKWYWYLPIIGFITYMYQQSQVLTSIDRGVLRRNINKASLRWLYLDVPFFYIFFIVIIFNYFPWRSRKVFKRAIELTKEEKDK